MNLFEKITKKFSVFNEILKFPFILYPESYYDSDVYTTNHDGNAAISVAKRNPNGKYFITAGDFKWSGILPWIAFNTLLKHDKTDIWYRIQTNGNTAPFEQDEFCKKLKKSGITVTVEEQCCEHIKDKNGNFFEFRDCCCSESYGYTIKGTIIGKSSSDRNYFIFIKNQFNKFECKITGEFAEKIYNTLLQMPRNLSFSK